MGKSGNRVHRRKGAGAPRKSSGKRETSQKAKTTNARNTVLWQKQLSDWKKSFSISKGEPIAPMAARLLLVVTISFALQAGSAVKFTTKKGFQFMTGVYQQVQKLTGVSVAYLSQLFKSVETSAEGVLNYTVSDPSIRGRGSPNVNRKKLRNLRPRHYMAIEKYIDHCNSVDGAGKVYILPH